MTGAVDIDPGPWAAWLSIAAIVLGAVLSGAAFYISAQIRSAITREFGGNGGGMREALNAVREDVTEIKGSVAAVDARMDRHLEQHAKH